MKDRRILRPVPIALLAVLIGTSPAAAAVTWTSATQLEQDGGLPTHQLLATCSSTVHLLHSANDDRVVYRRSTDDAATWESAVVLAQEWPAAYSQLRPLAIVCSGDTVVAMFEDWKSDGSSQLFTRRSNDGGQTWKAPYLLASYTGLLGTASLVIGGGRVTAGWSERNGNVVIRQSLDGAKTFAPKRVLGSTTAIDNAREGTTNAFLSLAATGNRLYAVWIPEADDSSSRVPRIVMRRSKDAGVTFGAQRNVTTASTYRTPIATAAEADSLYVMTTSIDPQNVVVYVSSDRGSSFTMKYIRLSAGARANDVAVLDGTVRATYGAHGFVGMRTSSDGGATWPENQSVPGGAISATASIAMNSSWTFVATSWLYDDQVGWPRRVQVVRGQ